MPSAVSAYYAASAVYATNQEPSTHALGEAGPTSTGGDSVELSQSSSAYRPAAVEDKFQFEIDSGMLDSNRRYSALSTRFGGQAAQTYTSRGRLSSQVALRSGRASAYSALFALQYQDSRPNPSGARSHVNARVGFARITDQNLALLNSL